MKTKWIAFIGTGLVVASLMVSGASFAKSSESEKEIRNGTIPIPRTTEADYPGMAKISFDQAIQKALGVVEGKVLKSELEEEDGFLVYEVEIVGPNRSVTEVKVDAGNGEILEIEQDSDEGEEHGENETDDSDRERDDD
jgi:uncharacterized membrane protein YkoI